MKRTFHEDSKIFRVFSPLTDYECVGNTVEPLNIILRKLKYNSSKFRKSIDEDAKKQIELPSNLKKYKSRATQYDELYQLMERFGSQSFCIELLKEYQCNSKYELDCETAKIAIQRRADKLCLSDKTDLNTH
jgi:hypothetical protein